MIPFLFETPAKFADPLFYERVGAMIHERASGHIVGHIQELGGWGLLSKMPIPGGNPLGLVTEGIQIGQLHGIQQTLNTVQTLATVGAVASVATLGVSIAGFAAVLSKLKRIEGKLDQVRFGLDQVRCGIAKLQKSVESLGDKIEALEYTKLRQSREAISLAKNYPEYRRNIDLTDAISTLAKSRDYYGGLLASPEFCTIGTQYISALLEVQEKLVAACEGELLAELLLGSSPNAITARWNEQNNVLDAIAWTSAKSLYQLAEQGDRDSGVYLVTSAQERSDKVTALWEIRKESTARLASLPVLAQFLHDRDVSGLDYMQLLEEQEKAGKSLVVITAR